jgi:zinc protease
VKGVVAVTLLVAGCAGAPAPSVARAPLGPAVHDPVDAPFRATAPALAPAPPFAAPRIDAATLSNGIRVLVVERRELPIVSVDLVVRTGFVDVDGDAPEAALLMAAVLEQGAATRSAAAIADGWRAIAAEHRAWVDFDSGGAGFKVLSTSLDAAIALLADVVVRPAFAEEEIERARERWIGWAKQQRLAIDRRAASTLAAAVYGLDHPYGRTTLARVAPLAKVTRADVVRAYAHVLTPARATIVVAGDTSVAAIAPKLEEAFGAWRGAAPPSRAIALPVVDPSSARVVLCDAPRTSEPRVMIAEAGVPYGAPDRHAVLVMNEILGGAYASRIFRNLRETHGYTYGAFSSFAMRRGPGPFSAGGAIEPAHVGDAVRELLREIASIRDADVGDAELASAKRHLVASQIARFESVSDITRALGAIAIHELALDEWSTFAPRVDAVTIADVRRAANDHLHPERMKIVVTGDRGELAPILASLGLGAIELRDPDGAVVAP